MVTRGGQESKVRTVCDKFTKWCGFFAIRDETVRVKLSTVVTFAIFLSFVQDFSDDSCQLSFHHFSTYIHAKTPGYQYYSGKDWHVFHR